MSELTVHSGTNPVGLAAWEHTLPMELAMRVAPVKDICEAYNLTKEDYDALRANPRFVKEVAEWRETLKEEGMSFRIKARMQSEELLKTSWSMIHDKTVPASVRADLIKHTARVAGLEPQKNESVQPGANFAIQINLGEK